MSPFVQNSENRLPVLSDKKVGIKSPLLFFALSLPVILQSKQDFQVNSPDNCTSQEKGQKDNIKVLFEHSNRETLRSRLRFDSFKLEETPNNF